MSIARRFASAATKTSASGPSASTSAPRKIVLVGAGFLVLVSRNPRSLYERLKPLGSQILPPAAADITTTDTSDLKQALEGASAVVSLVGVLVGNEKKMEEIQLKGATRVAQAAKEQGVDRVVLMSAIGASKLGDTPYWRTKGAAEEAFLNLNPTSTIIRPSIVFGPGDSFFNRFSTLAKYLPFLPVFGGGAVRFQPVYAGDVARLVEICCRSDPEVVKQVGGKVIEAGGPDVFTYREIMKLVLRYSGLENRRLILSLPYWIGMLQGFFLEKLPENLFTVTRDQVQQLRHDNIVSPVPPLDSAPFAEILSAFPSSLPSSAPVTKDDTGLTSVYKILPTYLGPQPTRQEGKRTHGRPGVGFEEIERLRQKTK